MNRRELLKTIAVGIASVGIELKLARGMPEVPRAEPVTEDVTGGTWEERTIYRKVIDFGSLPTEDHDKAVPHRLPEHATIVDLRAIAKDEHGNVIGLPSPEAFLMASGPYVVIRTPKDESHRHGTVFVQYVCDT